MQQEEDTAPEVQQSNADVIPIDDRVFVNRHTNNEETEPALFRGTVVAVGPGMPTMSGARMALPVKVGDGLIYPMEAVTIISLNGDKAYDVIHFRDAYATLVVGKEKQARPKYPR